MVSEVEVKRYEREEVCLKVREGLITRKREWVKLKRSVRGGGSDR